MPQQIPQSNFALKGYGKIRAIAPLRKFLVQGKLFCLYSISERLEEFL
jgi:hypothetical protein